VAIRDVFDNGRRAYENLNDRERRLVTILAIVLGALAVLVPLWLITSSIGDIEDENAQIRDVLGDISRARVELAQREAERQAAERRYDSPAPPLGSFLEAHAREAGYSAPLEVTDQPDQVASGFTKRGVRASLRGVGLRTAVDLMAAVENANKPVAIDMIQVEHFQNGDQYNVQLGVIAFDRQRARQPQAEESGGEGRTKVPTGRAGPPEAE